MADDRNIGQQYNYAPIPVRIIHEYDFFAETAAKKYKQTYILPLPQNPEALRDVPELVPPRTVFRGQKKTCKVSHQEIPHDPKLIDKAAKSVRIFGVDINIVDQETSINKGKEKMPHVDMGESSSNIHGIIINELDKNTTIAAATNLGNPSVDHQVIRDIPKLVVDGINLGLHDDDQETTRSINKGKEKMHNSSPLSSRSTKGIIIKEEKMEKKKKTSKRKLENSGLDDHEEKARPLFHPSILEEIQDGHDPPVFLFEKKLTISDTIGGLNRLLISDADKLLEFLSEEEKIKVNDKQDNLVVITREALSARNEHTLHLTLWNVNNGTIYLKHEWHKFVNAQRLQCGNLVQGWGYRQGNEFRLALNIIKHN